MGARETEDHIANKLRRRVLASAMKNEAPYVLEWVAYHRVLGFDDIVIGSNDCSDQTDHILQALAEAGAITHVLNIVDETQAPQHAFYDRLQQDERYAEIEWLGIVDADEFINIHVGAGKLDDLLQAAGPVDIIQLDWAVFGDSHQTQYDERLVLERFTQRMQLGHRINAGCKCLTRNPSNFRKMRNHNPVGYIGEGEELLIFHGGKVQRLPPYTDLTDALQYTETGNISFNVAQVNHYAIKSRQEYELRKVRGNGARSKNRPGRQRYDERYFHLRSMADVE